MVATRAPTSDRISGGDGRQQPAAAQTVAPEVHHSRRLFHFWRHFLGDERRHVDRDGRRRRPVQSHPGRGFGTAITEARLQYPELAVLVMGFNMTVPMVAWMRHRGHGRRSSAEMGLAMFAPAIPVIALLRSDVIGFAAVCGLYCAVMLAAMLALVPYRRSEYTM